MVGSQGYWSLSQCYGQQGLKPGTLMCSDSFTHSMRILWQCYTSSLQAVQLLSQFFPLKYNTRIFLEQHIWIVPANHDKHCTLKLRDVLVQHVILDYQWNLISQTFRGNLQIHTNYIKISKSIFVTRHCHRNGLVHVNDELRLFNL